MKQPTRQSVPHRPAETQLVEIEKPLYGGAFLARMQGKVVFVPLTLPGEQARVRIAQEKRGYATAEVEEIIAASPERIASACAHFGACGGCSYQHTSYETQLRWKQAILHETLERGGVPVPAEIAVLAAEPWGYRNRVRLAFDAQGKPGYHGRRSHAVIPIDACPIAAPLLIDATRAFADALRHAAPSQRATEITLFCNVDATALLASIVTAGRTEIRLKDLAHAVAARVTALKGVELNVEAHTGRRSRSVAQWGDASLAYRAAGFDYRVDFGAFFQVNRWLVDALVEQVAAGQHGTVAWDLFAGVGLFARKLTRSFTHVIAVESAPASTAALAHNLRDTSAEPVQSETLAFLRSRTGSEHPDLIVVDPPRTGLGAETTTLLAAIAAPSLVYVSCDPATLARDLHALTGSGYAIQSITLTDLFPQTFHLETVVHLHRS